jgi:hypothetical protein
MNELVKKMALDALENFQRRYPASTSGDLQTFAFGYETAVKDVAKLLNSLKE